MSSNFDIARPGFSEYREDNNLRMFIFRKQHLRRPSTDVFETLPYDVALAAVESLLRRFLESK